MIMMGDKKRMVNAILGPKEPEKKEPEPGDSSLEAVAQEAIDAIHAKDAHGFVEALRALFAEFDAEPHREGPHTEDED